MDWNRNESLLLVDFYFRKTKSSKVIFIDSKRLFLQFLKYHAQKLNADFDTAINCENKLMKKLEALRVFIDEKRQDIDTISSFDRWAYKLYMTDRIIFYDKIRSIFAFMSCDQNYNQILPNATPSEIVQNSWFVQAYVNEQKIKNPTTFDIEKAKYDMLQFFTIAEKDVEKSNVLLLGFCLNTLFKLRELIESRFVFAQIVKNDDSIKNYKFCLNLVGKFIEFESSRIIQETPATRQGYTHTGLIDDDYLEDAPVVKEKYNKRDALYYDNVTQFYFEKYCVIASNYSNVRIESLQLCEKTKFCLIDGRVDTLEDLLKMSPVTLHDLYDVGPLMISEIEGLLNRLFGDKNEQMHSQQQKSLTQAKQSLEVRKLLPLAKQYALKYLYSIVHQTKVSCDCRANIKRIIDSIYNTLGRETCEFLLENFDATISISSILYDLTESDFRKEEYCKTFDGISANKRLYQAKPLVELCDLAHNSKIADMKCVVDIKAIADFESLKGMHLSRKESADLIFFLEWVERGADDIASEVLRLLFTTKPIRLEIVKSMANVNDIALCAKQNYIKPYTTSIVVSQAIAKFSQLPQCEEIVQYVSACHGGKAVVSRQDYFDVFCGDDAQIMYFLSSHAKAKTYTFDEQGECFVIHTKYDNAIK